MLKHRRLFSVLTGRAHCAQLSLPLAKPVPSFWWALAVGKLLGCPLTCLSSASVAQDQSPVTPVSTLCAEARERHDAC